jgi:hypothetical protein
MDADEHRYRSQFPAGEELEASVEGGDSKDHRTVTRGSERGWAGAECEGPFQFARWAVQVGEFIPDQMAFDGVIVDTKMIDRITDHERGRMLNPLRSTHLRARLIMSFKHARLE